MSPALAYASAALGLASIPHCMGMCGPIACSLEGHRASGAYHLTRALGYVALGALVGGAADALRLQLVRLTPALAIATALVLTISAYRRVARAPALVPATRLVRSASASSTAGFALGATTPLLPCGTLHGALLGAAASGRASDGAFAMAIYAAVTGVGLVGSVEAARILDRSRVGRFGVAAVLLVGAALVLGRGLAPDEEPACHAPAEVRS